MSWPVKPRFGSSVMIAEFASRAAGRISGLTPTARRGRNDFVKKCTNLAPTALTLPMRSDRVIALSNGNTSWRGLQRLPRSPLAKRQARPEMAAVVRSMAKELLQLAGNLVLAALGLVGLLGFSSHRLIQAAAVWVFLGFAASTVLARLIQFRIEGQRQLPPLRLATSADGEVGLRLLAQQARAAGYLRGSICRLGIPLIGTWSVAQGCSGGELRNLTVALLVLFAVAQVLAVRSHALASVSMGPASRG